MIIGIPCSWPVRPGLSGGSCSRIPPGTLAGGSGSQSTDAARGESAPLIGSQTPSGAPLACGGIDRRRDRPVAMICKRGLGLHGSGSFSGVCGQGVERSGRFARFFRGFRGLPTDGRTVGRGELLPKTRDVAPFREGRAYKSHKLTVDHTTTRYLLCFALRSAPVGPWRSWFPDRTRRDRR